MKYQDRLIKDLAKKYNRDPRVIKEIVYSPIKFANRVISNPTDLRPVRVRYFGVFVLKHKDAKMNMFKKRVGVLKKSIVKTMLIMDQLGYMIKDENSVFRILDDALETSDYDKIEAIWDEYKIIKNK